MPDISHKPLAETAGRAKKAMAALPARLLAAVSAQYPDIWKKVDETRREFMDAAGSPPWNPSIFLPGSCWKGIQAYYGREYGTPGSSLAFYRLMCAGTWRPTQDIIAFDPNLYEALITTPLQGRLPYAALLRFPAWCLYFDAPGLELEGKSYAGFFAMLDELRGQRHLVLYFLGDGREYYAQPIRLGDWDLKEGILSVVRDSGRLKPEELARLQNSALRVDMGITAAINLILYALSQPGSVHAGSAAARPQARKTKKGWRLFPPASPTFHLLGEEMGRQLREAAKSAKTRSGQRASPCPHIRRGHWHHYWKGPKKSVLDLRWLPPIPVALAQTETAALSQTWDNDLRRANPA